MLAVFKRQPLIRVFVLFLLVLFFIVSFSPAAVLAQTEVSSAKAPIQVKTEDQITAQTEIYPEEDQPIEAEDQISAQTEIPSEEDQPIGSDLLEPALQNKTAESETDQAESSAEGTASSPSEISSKTEASSSGTISSASESEVNSPDPEASAPESAMPSPGIVSRNDRVSSIPQPDSFVSEESNNELWNEELSATLSMACEWARNSEMGDFYFLCMGSAGQTAPSKAVNQYITDVSLRTEYDEIRYLAYDILNVTYCGYDASNLFGKDLIDDMLYTFSYDEEDMHTNAYILLALDSNRYEVSTILKNSRQNMIKRILSFQNEDGGFSNRTGDPSSVSETALAIAALASRRDRQEEIADAIDSALLFLQDAQQADGGFSEDGIFSSSAVSKVIIALNCLGISMDDPRFVKNGENLIQVLLRNVHLDGGFSELTEEASDVVATENAILALTSVKRQASPYRMANLLIQEMVPEEKLDIAPEVDYSWVKYVWLGSILLLFCLVLFLLIRSKITNQGSMSEEEKFILYGVKEENEDHTDVLEEPDPRLK